jgi:hypothetical protein
LEIFDTKTKAKTLTTKEFSNSRVLICLVQMRYKFTGYLIAKTLQNVQKNHKTWNEERWEELRQSQMEIESSVEFDGWKAGEKTTLALKLARQNCW